MKLAEIGLEEIEIELKRRKRLEAAALREQVRSHQQVIQKLEKRIQELNAAPLGKTPSWVFELLTG